MKKKDIRKVSLVGLFVMSLAVSCCALYVIISQILGRARDGEPVTSLVVRTQENLGSPDNVDNAGGSQRAGPAANLKASTKPKGAISQSHIVMVTAAVVVLVLTAVIVWIIVKVTSAPMPPLPPDQTKAKKAQEESDQESKNSGIVFGVILGGLVLLMIVAAILAKSSSMIKKRKEAGKNLEEQRRRADADAAVVLDQGSRSQEMPPGLKNYGDTAYLGSLLQALSWSFPRDTIDALVDKIIEGDIQDLKDMKYPMFPVLMIIYCLKHGGRNPTKFYSGFVQWYNREHGARLELLRLLCDTIEPKPYLVSTFLSILKVSYRIRQDCDTCGPFVEDQQSSAFIPLTIDNNFRGVDEAITDSLTTSGNIKVSNQCSRCRLFACRRKVHELSLGPVLVLAFTHVVRRQFELPIDGLLQLHQEYNYSLVAAVVRLDNTDHVCVVRMDDGRWAYYDNQGLLSSDKAADPPSILHYYPVLYAFYAQRS